MFYTYRQNNSGGDFVIDDCNGITVIVIVEADSAREANLIAQDVGLYFDGAGDCSCCGNRWYEQDDDKEGEQVPSVWGTPVEDYKEKYRWAKKSPEVYVHYKNGTIKGFCYA